MKRVKVMVFVAVLAVSLWAAGSLRAATAPGDMVWPQAQIITFTGCDTILIGAVAASNNALIVCGTAFKQAIDTGDIGFIKAFDQATGNVKWQQTLTTGTNRNSFNSLALIGNTVVVEGYSSTYTLVNNDYIYTLNQTALWAYNADTGDLLWGPVNKTAAPTNLGPNNIITANNKVFVVRKEQGYNFYGTTGNCIVEAYQVGAASLAPLSLLLQ